MSLRFSATISHGARLAFERADPGHKDAGHGFIAYTCYREGWGLCTDDVFAQGLEASTMPCAGPRAPGDLSPDFANGSPENESELDRGLCGALCRLNPFNALRRRNEVAVERLPPIHDPVTFIGGLRVATRDHDAAVTGGARAGHAMLGIIIRRESRAGA